MRGGGILGVGFGTPLRTLILLISLLPCPFDPIAPTTPRQAFAHQYHAPTDAQTEYLRTFFRHLDDDDSGFLDFREYLVGLALLNEADNSKNRIDVVRYAFEVPHGDCSPCGVWGVLSSVRMVRGHSGAKVLALSSGASFGMI